MKSVIVIAAHPDDEVLGCGGTIAKHFHDGDEVHVLILAEGMTSRDDTRNREARTNDIVHLKNMANQAHKILGSTSVQIMDFPDNRMDSIDLLDVVKVVENEINERKPEIVYTHHSGDLNIDHRITHQAVFTACRPKPNTTVKKISAHINFLPTIYSTPDSILYQGNNNNEIHSWNLKITNHPGVYLLDD